MGTNINNVWMFSTTQMCQGKSTIFMFKTLCHPFVLGTPVRDGLIPWRQRSSVLGPVSPLHHAQLCKVHLFVTTIPGILASTTPYIYYIYIIYIYIDILYNHQSTGSNGRIFCDDLNSHHGFLGSHLCQMLLRSGWSSSGCLLWQF